MTGRRKPGAGGDNLPGDAAKAGSIVVRWARPFPLPLRAKMAPMAAAFLRRSSPRTALPGVAGADSHHGLIGNGCFWQVTLWFQSAKLLWVLLRQAQACNSYTDGSP